MSTIIIVQVIINNYILLVKLTEQFIDEIMSINIYSCLTVNNNQILIINNKNSKQNVF